MTGFNKSILLILLLFAACSKVVNISNINYMEAYQPAPGLISPVYHLMHIDDSQSRLLLRVAENELLYLRDSKEEFYVSRFQVTLSVFESYQKKSNVFRSELEFRDTIIALGNTVVKREITFPMRMGKRYHVYIELQDQNRRISQTMLLQSDKRSRFSEGFFTISRRGSEIIYPLPFRLPANELLTINHTQINDFVLEVSRFQVPEYFPLAPYVIHHDGYDQPWPVADTTFLITFTDGNTQLLLPGNGIYRLFDPGNVTHGFLITSFWDTYPKIPNDERMLFPLRYITSADEFNSLLALDAPELAAERFWSGTSGNPDRAAAVFRRYNERVVHTNRLFSSHVPGWQTDRGMIYIVMGPPDMVYRSDTGETWYYRETMNNPSAEVRFTRTDNIFSDNHLVLERTTALRRSWNLAVDRWRR